MAKITRRKFLKYGTASMAGAGLYPEANKADAFFSRLRKRFFPRTSAETLADPLDCFDHVVVLMMENRSFDNQLGYLYSPNEVPPNSSFDGVAGKSFFNTPSVLGDAPVELRETLKYHQPFPDPGEVYPHVNTQLFDVINAPYNLPDPVPPTAPMSGFVNDYIVNYPPHLADPPSRAQYRVIMESFARRAVNVTSTLAREFAVFDHWFCSVPSQTWCNRAFWNAATSWGHVSNPTSAASAEEWLVDSRGRTIFNELTDAGLDWAVYSSNLVSLTGLIHEVALTGFSSNFSSLEQFFEDCASGDLPKYSFLEPVFITPHNDQHPSSYDSILYGPAAVGSVLLGEILINKVYNAIRTSTSNTGNNWKNTILIITHDEHGGNFDHVSPPAAVPPGSPTPSVFPLPEVDSRMEDEFQYDRLGVRVPMIMVSAFIAPQTIVNTVHDHTSFLKTLETKWDLPNLTSRDQNAEEFSSVFSLETARDASQWPVIADPLLPEGFADIDFTDAPINDLQRSMVAAVLATSRAGSSALAAEDVKTVGQAIDVLQSVPNLLGSHPLPDRSFLADRTSTPFEGSARIIHGDYVVIRLNGRMGLTRRIHLRSATLTLEHLLDERGGAGELFAGAGGEAVLPMTLRPRWAGAHWAYFRSPIGQRPRVHALIAVRGGTVTLRIRAAAGILSEPQNPGGTPLQTLLLTAFELSDGRHHPVHLATVQSWELPQDGGRLKLRL